MNRSKVQVLSQPPNYGYEFLWNGKCTVDAYVAGSNPVIFAKLYGRLAQLVRALACHARGRGFESLNGRHICLLGSMVERLPDLQEIEVQFF